MASQGISLVQQTDAEARGVECPRSARQASNHAGSSLGNLGLAADLLPQHTHHHRDASRGADDGREDRHETEEKENFDHAS